MFNSRRSFFKKLGLAFSGSLLGRDKPSRAEVPQADASPDEAQSHIRREYDLVVVGGGIAGVSTSIAAARHGLRVALVHNRSMPGGNSSSEVKLFPENNSGHQPWIKEGGIHEEFHTEERVRNHREYREGTMNCHWDLVLYEWLIREPNIELYLNTHMHRTLMASPSRIAAVFCFQVGTEKTCELSAPLFVDSTGDGYLGERAGAEFRWGREGRRELGEPLAPPQPDEKVMGNTLMFTAVEAGRPVPFKRPDWAAEFPTEKDLYARGHSYLEGGYWWIEIGAPYHPIGDNNRIVHEGLRQLLGVWDHIKNQCEQKEKAQNYGLEFVGFWPYKRECRRIRGDYVLTQQHVQDPKPLPDAVAYGAWGIDIHVQGGILNREERPYPPPRTDENFDKLGTVVYGIPLRALYSRNVENLMMAGRPISGSYVAFASSRVLSTGSIVGQAVGTAASLCKKHKTTPARIAQTHIKECQQLILRGDGHIPGVVNDDPADLARQATVTASSQWALAFPEPNVGSQSLQSPRALLFPVSENRIDEIELMFWSRLEKDAEIEIGLRPAEHVWDFRATHDIARSKAVVPAKQTAVWVSFPLSARVEPGRLYYVYTRTRNPDVLWKTFHEKDGEPNRIPVGVTAADMPGKLRWRPRTGGTTHVIRLHPDSRPYAPQNVVTGTHRPDGWTNIWISDPGKGLPAWVELRWPKPVTFNTVQLTFDTDQNRRVTLPLFRYPDCVKDYALQARTVASWTQVAEVRDNYVRHRVHHVEPVRTDRLRLMVTATNGSPSARVYEIRVYGES